MNSILPTFHETPWGYESISRDGAHTYVITSNSIDYDVTHYWEGNPTGEFLGTSTTPAGMAREHYALASLSE
jgi:hypothetical protein